LTGNSFHLSGYNVDICNFSKKYLLDCLYESGILTSVEEEENPELTSAEENIKLTPLEKAFFEKAYEIACDLEDETVHLDQHQVDDYVADIFNDIFITAKYLDIYWLWLDERQKQEAVTVL
jgi:hypothetical protein